MHHSFIHSLALFVTATLAAPALSAPPISDAVRKVASTGTEFTFTAVTEVAFDAQGNSKEVDALAVHADFPQSDDFFVSRVWPGPDLRVITADGKSYPLISTPLPTQPTPPGARPMPKHPNFSAALYVSGGIPPAPIVSVAGNLNAEVHFGKASVRIPYEAKALFKYESGAVPSPNQTTKGSDGKTVLYRWLMWNVDSCQEGVPNAEGLCVDSKTKKTSQPGRQFDLMVKLDPDARGVVSALLNPEGQVVPAKKFAYQAYPTGPEPHRESWATPTGYKPMQSSSAAWSDLAPARTDVLAGHQAEIRYWSTRGIVTIPFDALPVSHVQHRRTEIRTLDPEGKAEIAPPQTVWAQFTMDPLQRTITEVLHDGKTTLHNRLERRGTEAKFDLSNKEGAYAGEVTFFEPFDILKSSWEVRASVTAGSYAIHWRFERVKDGATGKGTLKDANKKTVARLEAQMTIVSQDVFRKAVDRLGK